MDLFTVPIKVAPVVLAAVFVSTSILSASVRKPLSRYIQKEIRFVPTVEKFIAGLIKDRTPPLAS